MTKKQVYANDIFFGLTAPVRVLFPPSLADPRQIDGRGDAKYEVQIGFPEDHPEYLDLKKTVARIAREKFGDDVNIREDLELKFRSGDEEYEAAISHPEEAKRRDYPFLKGLVVMKLRSKKPISVFDVRRRNDKGVPIKISDQDEIAQTIYSGCYVSLKLTFATYDRIDRNTKPGVTAYPEQICFVNHGERLGGGNKDDGSGFSSVQGAISDVDPTGEADDDIPF